jgi:hypothetical protein
MDFVHLSRLYWEKNMVVMKVLASTIMHSNQTRSCAIMHKLLIACFDVLKYAKCDLFGQLFYQLICDSTSQKTNN